MHKWERGNGKEMIDMEFHAKAKGVSCPFWKAESTQGGFIQVDSGEAIQEMGCIEYGGKRQDVYRLFDITSVKIPIK